MRNALICTTVFLTAASIAAASGPLRGPVQTTDASIVLPIEIRDDLAFSSSPEGDHVALPGFFPGGAPGDPQLPWYRFKFLLPGDVVWETVDAVLEQAAWEAVPGEFDLAPAPPATTSVSGEAVVAWGAKDPGRIADGRDTSVYGLDAVFPPDPICGVLRSQYRQWNLAYVTLCPVAYNPVQKGLARLRSAVIRATFSRSGTSPVKAAARDAEEFWKPFAAGLENVADRDQFYPGVGARGDAAKTGPGTDYVIVTTSYLEGVSTKLADFVQSRTQLGYGVAVVTEGVVEDDGHYVSGGSQEARAYFIREWLKARYASWGVRYVLLVGNPDPTEFDADTSVPMLMCYPRSYDHDEDSTPTDLCYAELSGNWDVDGDGYPGEWGYNSQDFAPGGIDLDPEVAVGRIPYYGVPDHLDSILHKTIEYETASGDIPWRRKILIPAAISNFDEDTDNNGTVDLSPHVFGDCWGELQKVLAEGYGYATYTLYEKQGCKNNGTDYPTTPCDAPLTPLNLRTAWFEHHGFVTWWAHGSAALVWRKYWANDNYNVPPVSANDDIPQTGDGSAECPTPPFWSGVLSGQLDDSYPSFVVQSSCNNGEPEVVSNLGYALLVNGAIGTISASRVSWYAVTSWHTGLGLSGGDNTSYCYYTFDRMAGAGDTIGEALNWCRANFGTSWGSSSWMNRLDFNLYGDPAATQEIDDLSVTPDEDFSANGIVGGALIPDSITYTLTNDGSGSLDWTASKTAAWLDLSDTVGTLATPGAQATVEVVLNATAATLDPGTYTDTIVFTNTDSGFQRWREVVFDLRELHAFAWDAIPAPQTAYAPFEVTVTAQDPEGATVAAFEEAISLSGSAPGKTGDPVPIFPTTTGAFVHGVWHGMVTVLEPAECTTLLADDGNGHVGASDNFDVTGGGEASCIGNILFAQAESFVALLDQIQDPEVVDMLPGSWSLFDFENGDLWLDWINGGQHGAEPDLGDGIPDAWQVALLAEVLDWLWSPEKGEWCDYAHAVRDTFEANYAAWTTAINARLVGETDPDMIALLETLRDDVGLFLAAVLCLSQDAQDGYLGLLSAMGITGNFVAFSDDAKAANEPFHAEGDIDNDGKTNLEEYTCVVDNGGDIDIFLQAALYDDPFWPGNPDLPALTGLALILLAAACGLCGAEASRRH